MHVLSQSVDPRREEFRKYLESVGIFDSLTKAFLNLFEEENKPEDPLRYIKQQLGINGSNNMESLKEQLIEAKQKLEELKEENNDLLAKIKQYENKVEGKTE
ncbi:c-Myc-binding protein-like isoform X2 [Centruroides vittatus]|uniref:c-Myc-binding protein-like isoform X2 n=1 Tax=Centruroides vittatus TaxID=120091 RepID=UPI003510C7CA